MNNLGASIEITGGAITPDPELSVSSASVAFGNVTVGTSATKTFTVTGSDLTNNVSVSSNNSLLNVSPTSLTIAQAQATATITLSLTPAAAGSGSAVVTVASTGATSKTVNVSWTAVEQGGNDPTPTNGKYSRRTFNSDSTICTWDFQNVVSADVNITSEEIDNDIVFKPTSGNKMKATTSGLSSQTATNYLYIPVPAGAAGTIAMTTYSSSNSRWFQLYVNGTDAGVNKRLWSKAGTNLSTTGPQSFSFTASDFTQYNGNYYLVLANNATEMKVATFEVSLTTGSYGSGSQQGGNDPTPSGDIVIDGNFDDWSDSSLPQAELPSGASYNGLYGMRWFANETDVFFYLEYDPATGPIDMFLSTDENSATGHAAWMFTNAGAEFLIEGEPADFNDASFFVFDNNQPQDEWDNGWVETSVSNLLTASNVVTLANGHNAFEGKILQANLGTITTLRVGVMTMDATWTETGWLPQGAGGASVQMLEVPIYRTPTSVDVVNTSNAARKVIRNGQLLIIRDGKVYTAQGQIYE